MSEEMTKAELLAKIRAERERFEATLAEVDEARMTEPGVVSGWSVKDILAHIAVWEGRMVGWLAEISRGEVPEALAPGQTWDDLDQLNEQTYLENRDRPLAEVLAEFAASFRRASDAVEAAPEEMLLDPDRYPWREGQPVWHMVAANTFWHYSEHGASIRAWLQRLESSAASAASG
jgi:uncharacterized protein (TIGR03083 family)